MSIFRLFQIFLIVIVISFGPCFAMNFDELKIVGPIGIVNNDIVTSYWFHFNDQGEYITCTKYKENNSYSATRHLKWIDVFKISDTNPKYIDIEKLPNFVPESIDNAQEGFEFAERNYIEQEKKN